MSVAAYRVAGFRSGQAVPFLLGLPGDVVWHSSDENVATVSGGLVRAVSDGQAQIVATWGGSQAQAVLRVVGSGKKQ